MSFTGEFQIDTKASLLMDMKTGRVLYAQDADTPIPPMKTVPAGSVIDDRPRRIQIALARYWGSPVEIPMDQLVRDIVYELDKR